MNLRLILRIARYRTSGTLLLTGRMVAAGRIYMPGRIRLYEYPDGNSKNKSIGQHDHF